MVPWPWGAEREGVETRTEGHSLWGISTHDSRVEQAL